MAESTPPSLRTARGIRRVVCLALLSATSAGGCGGEDDGFERFPVEGRVTLDGKDLESGTVNFVADQNGPSESCEISAGRFQLPRDQGLSPGTYRVEVYSIKPTGRKVPDPDNPKQLIEERTNVVPPHYNINSKLKAEVPPAGLKEQLTFTLTAGKGR
jgi:hypothetical protein